MGDLRELEAGDDEYFSWLPDEVMMHILSFLHVSDVVKLECVNSRFQRLSHTQLNRIIDLSRCYNCPLGWLTRFLRQRSEVVRVLNLSHNHWLSARDMEKLAVHMTNVTSLDVRGCCVSEQCLEKILARAAGLRSLAYTDRGFLFAAPSNEDPGSIVAGGNGGRALSAASLQTLAGLRELRVVLTVCWSAGACLPALCPNLTSLCVDSHMNLNWQLCGCCLESTNGRVYHLPKLRELCYTTAAACYHPSLVQCLNDLLRKSQEGQTAGSPVKLVMPFINKRYKLSVRLQTYLPGLTHLAFYMNDLHHHGNQAPLPSLRYLALGVFAPSLCLAYPGSPEVTLAFPLLFPNLRYLTLCQMGRDHCLSEDELPYGFLDELASRCPRLRGLGLQGVHAKRSHVECNPALRVLSQLRRLQHLSISPRTLHPFKKTSIFDSPKDVGESDSSAASRDCNRDNTGLFGLVRGCPGLSELELIDVDTEVELYSRDFPRRKISHLMLPGPAVLNDVSLPALGGLCHLQRLTLAGYSPAVGGRGGGGFFAAIFKGCSQLCYLSLADLGLRGHCTWLPAFCQALRHAVSLQDLRIEHKNMDISALLQESLRECSKLRRLCLVTVNGKIQQPSTFEGVFASCPRLNLLMVVTADASATRRELRGEITKKYKAKRVPLCVVFGSSKDLEMGSKSRQEMLKYVPNVDLGELVLFRSHVFRTDRQIGMA